MTPFEQLLGFLVAIIPRLSVWLLVKLMILIGGVLYLAFGGIIIRQTALMTRTLDGGISTAVKIVAWGHLVVAAAIFLLAFFIL